MAFIHINFASLPAAVKRLQYQGISLPKAIEIILDISTYLNQLTDTTIVKTKLQTVFNKN